MKIRELKNKMRDYEESQLQRQVSKNSTEIVFLKNKIKYLEHLIRYGINGYLAHYDGKYDFIRHSDIENERYCYNYANIDTETVNEIEIKLPRGIGKVQYCSTTYNTYDYLLINYNKDKEQMISFIIDKQNEIATRVDNLNPPTMEWKDAICK